MGLGLKTNGTLQYFTNYLLLPLNQLFSNINRMEGPSLSQSQYQQKFDHSSQAQVNVTPTKISLLTYQRPKVSLMYLHRKNIIYIAISLFLLFMFIFLTLDSSDSYKKIIPSKDNNQNELSLFNSISYNLSRLRNSKCEGQSKTCLEQTESFNQIVSMMKMMTQTYQLDKDKKKQIYFQSEDRLHLIKQKLDKLSFQQKITWLEDTKKSKLQKLQLKGLEHLRLTSPKQKQFLKFTLQTVKEYLGLDSSYYFEGLNDMLQNDGAVWKSDGSMMTVFSGQPISPLIFKMQLAQNYLQQTQKIYIFGLKAQQAVLSVQNTLLHNLLGKYRVKKSSQQQNSEQYIFYCQNFECQQKYSLILLIMKPIHLRSFQIYQLLEQIQDKS